MPGTQPDQKQLAYWLARYTPAELDAPLLSIEDIERYDHAVGRSGDAPYSQRDLLVLPTPAQLQHELTQRLAYLRERLVDQRYVDGQGKSVPESVLAPFQQRLPELAPELRVALDFVQLQCGPLTGPLFDRPAGGAKIAETAYDRNACSAARAQEVVQLLAPWSGDLWLARTRYALGFVDRKTARLSPPIPGALVQAFVRGPRAHASAPVTLRSGAERSAELPKHASVPLTAPGRVTLASADGFREWPAEGLTPSARPLTRRALLTSAFGFIDSRYGFGDAGGGRDCSRLQLDLFESFDIALPRHSAWQAQSGSYRVDVSTDTPEAKLQILAQAAESGAVLLAFPGHIMLHLGKNDAGVPMVLHALGEYAQPCGGGKGETVLDVQRTVVSDLSLGQGSARKSLLERVTSLVVFGRPPPALLARAQTHALPPPEAPDPDQCKDSVDARIFTSPQRPIAGRALRLIATATDALDRPALWLFDPQGELVSAPSHRLGGPPSSAVARVDDPAEGRYTAVFADGQKTLACKRFPVHQGALAPGSAELGAPVWVPRFRWEADTLNLWAAFVEQLFDDPPDDERTWTNLHDLLRDPKRNLLHDHLGQDEDAQITLEPDCADLPYSLRAYFAWKLGLPFAYRQCARGKPGVPPTCGELRTNLMPREAPDDVAAFSIFVNRRVRSGVHSATGRTHPDDTATDLYPVALERKALPPGTVYADPYGHVLILTKWFPQGQDPADYGILMAAEAQPDGTVGRRRFFRGSFLFDPSTADAGAGFKQFRPLIFDRKLNAITALDNAALDDAAPFASFSRQQYQGSQDDFYDAMDRLINPAPLDPHVRLVSLLDAIDEAARRRVLAVDNGEQFMRESGGRPMAMPHGHDIFETTGPWEDFATPSRDMRLLIAIDSVLALPGQIEKAPERYKLKDAAAAAEAVKQIRADLERELKARTFAYTKSDGRPQTLSLADVLARSDALELAYNPNDCVELRWGAPEGSDELATCQRRAPAEQTERMQRYRTWFHERKRPPRGTK